MRGRTVIGSVILFILGGAGGVFAGYCIGKNKFLAMAEKEIESVRKVYEKHFSNNSNQVLEPKPVPAPLKNNDPQKEQYKKYAGVYQGNDSSEPKVGTVKSSISTKKVTKTPEKVPYIITPDEYRDSEYESETLIWYSDKILADADGNIIHNVNELIGPEALSSFGRYLDDTVYVRDDKKKIDYEIIWDARKFKSVNNMSGDETLSEEDTDN